MRKEVALAVEKSVRNLKFEMFHASRRAIAGASTRGYQYSQTGHRHVPEGDYSGYMRLSPAHFLIFETISSTSFRHLKFERWSPFIVCRVTSVIVILIFSSRLRICSSVATFFSSAFRMKRRMHFVTYKCILFVRQYTSQDGKSMFF